MAQMLLDFSENVGAISVDQLVKAYAAEKQLKDPISIRQVERLKRRICLTIQSLRSIHATFSDSAAPSSPLSPSTPSSSSSPPLEEGASRARTFYGGKTQVESVLIPLMEEHLAALSVSPFLEPSH
jgi:hypothetical protein